MEQPKFKTTGFALLDVGTGRNKLASYIEKHPNKKIPVVIYATIDSRFGGDDGVSIEFELDVNEMTVLDSIEGDVEWN